MKGCKVKFRYFLCPLEIEGKWLYYIIRKIRIISERKNLNMSITKTSFGQLPDGRKADLYIMTNVAGNSVEITNYGGIKKEMEALAERVERMQKHINDTMITLKCDQWNLEADAAEFNADPAIYEKAKA